MGGDLLEGLWKCADEVERRHMEDCAKECNGASDYDECYRNCIAKYVKFECGDPFIDDGYDAVWGRTIEEELYEE